MLPIVHIYKPVFSGARRRSALILSVALTLMLGEWFSICATAQNLPSIGPGEVVLPLPRGLQEKTIFSKSALGTMTPTNKWYQLPPWIIGKWGKGTQYRLSERDYKTGQVQNSRVMMYSPESPWLGTNTAEQTFEFTGQQDSSGHTWQFIGRPLIRIMNFDPGITAYNCSLSLSIDNRPPASTMLVQREQIESVWVSDKSQKILNVFRDVSVRQFQSIGPDRLEVTETTRSYDQFGAPLKDEVYQTTLSRVDANPRSATINCDNIPKPNAVELFKQFLAQSKLK